MRSARIRRPARGEMTFARQVGGRGQYAHVKIYVYPSPPGSGFVFESEIVGGAIPAEFIPAVERGLRHAATVGTPEGHSIDDVRVVLEDAAYHDVDSSEFAFTRAASMAFHNAVKTAGLVGDSSDDDGASFVTEPRRPSLTPRDSAIALPEPDDDDRA